LTTCAGWNEWSDIDVAVISPQIGPDRFEERVRLTKITFAVDDRIEPLPFSPDSFTPDDPLVREILRTGLRVWGEFKPRKKRVGFGGWPRYILDLLLSVINLSVQIVEIVERLPKVMLGTY
jgi:hypothetical protein